MPVDRDPLSDPRPGDDSQFGIVAWCRFDARRGGALCVGFEGGSFMTLSDYRENAVLAGGYRNAR